MTELPLDLIVLVADLDQEQTIRVLLGDRQRSLGIRPIRVEYLRHWRHDAGCFNEAPAILQSYQERASYALVLLDKDGSGKEHLSAEEIEGDLRDRLSATGWNDRAAAVVIEPELEIWIWSDSPEVEACLGWTGRHPALRDWLLVRELLRPDEPKPADPKHAFRCALREVGQRPSASVFARIAARVGIDRCRDPSFARLRTRLSAWFRVAEQNSV